VLVVAAPAKCTVEANVWPLAGLLTVTLPHAAAGSKQRARAVEKSLFMNLPRKEKLFCDGLSRSGDQGRILQAFLSESKTAKKTAKGNQRAFNLRELRVVRIARTTSLE
jgi:hypothetical protein